MITRVAAAAILALACSTAAPAWADNAPLVAGSVVPEADPFYAPPPDLASYRDGQLTSSREVAANIGVPVRAWQLSYRTNDSRDLPELAVTTVLVPTAPWSGPGPRPIVSEQIPEDSTGTRCAPSYGIAKGYLKSGEAVTRMLMRGWVVAVPDFEGPKSTFLTGPQSAHAVLDGIRAVEQFGPAGVGRDAVWALDGYSGGAAATGWAAQLQPDYAPELSFAGAAMGGVPADLTALTAHFDGGIFSSYNIDILVGYEREFPEAGIGTLLNERGRATLAAAGNSCVDDLLYGFPFRRLTDLSVVADPLRDPRLANLLRDNSLGASAPTMPIYNYHALTDEIIPVTQSDNLVAEWRAGGAAIVSVRDPIGEHGLESIQHMPRAQEFLQNRFAASAVAAAAHP
ncbi:lipase family protein [Nocardia sp. NPDC006630]|uniref:lipase family protein n=1 Tax=Nocardia sp. NPDC006630 TaxID=3157181 RepID=UPI00339DBF42